MIKRLFDYCFYRIALFYKNHLPLEDYITQGHTLLVSAIGFYTIALADTLLFLLGIKLSILLVMIIIAPFCVVVLFNKHFFPNSQQLFQEKQREYDNERCKWLKGSLVFLFLLGSVGCMLLVLFLKKTI